MARFAVGVSLLSTSGLSAPSHVQDSTVVAATQNERSLNRGACTAVGAACLLLLLTTTSLSQVQPGVQPGIRHSCRTR